ncbi:MAG TPA: DUF362 domain-containing protein [Acidobacteriota bacterium]|nr:DUF362 domain-containing protein [Acidobacteriota bacterium]
MNNSDWFTIPNPGGNTRLSSLTFSSALRQADRIVSMPRLRTHRWTGVTPSMKNMFGGTPGMFYGWPGNVLHVEGIDRSVNPDTDIVEKIIGNRSNRSTGRPLRP